MDGKHSKQSVQPVLLVVCDMHVGRCFNRDRSPPRRSRTVRVIRYTVMQYMMYNKLNSNITVLHRNITTSNSLRHTMYYNLIV